MPLLLAIKDLLLKRPWILIVVALAVYAAVLRFDLAKTAIARDKALARVDILTAKIDEQNRMIEAWKFEAANAEGQVIIARKKAARMRGVTQGRIVRIAAAPVPSACPEAVAWGAQAGIDLGRLWEEGR